MRARVSSFACPAFALIAAAFFALAACATPSSIADVEPQSGFPATGTVADVLGVGINLGNTFDAPYESAWVSGGAKESYFDDYKAAGFDSVRLPVTWSSHFATSAPYTIDSAWLNRVAQVVDWALERDLAVVLNAHHEDWIRLSYSSADLDRLKGLWSQLAARFKDYPDTLFFEILNEPNPGSNGTGMNQANVNEMNAAVLAVIRATNPTRWVIIGGAEWNSLSKLIDGTLVLPADSRIVGTFHFYTPYNFALNMGTGAVNAWGTLAEIAQLDGYLAQAEAWSVKTGIPVYMGEYGCLTSKNASSRLLWYQKNCEFARKRGIAYAAWENGNYSTSGETFGLYYRNTGTWEETVLAAVLGL